MTPLAFGRALIHNAHHITAFGGNMSSIDGHDGLPTSALKQLAWQSRNLFGILTLVLLLWSSAASVHAALPTEPEIQRDVTGAFGRLGACGYLASAKVESLKLVGIRVARDQMVGDADAKLAVDVPLKGIQRCSQKAQFIYLRTSKGWMFDGLKKPGTVRIGSDAVSLQEARARDVDGGDSGATGLPTDVEIQRYVESALQRPSACGFLGGPRVENLALKNVVVDGDRILGRFGAKLSIDVPLKGVQRCEMNEAFAFIRTSSGWVFNGLIPLKELKPSNSSVPIAQARLEETAKRPGPETARVMPTQVEVIAFIKGYFQGRPTACGKLGTAVVNDISLKDEWESEDKVGGGFSLALSIEVPLQGQTRCSESGQYSFIRTSNGWEFSGVFPSDPPLAPQGARRPSRPWVQDTLPGQWVAHFEHKGFSWDYRMNIRSVIPGEASGTWAIPSGGCEGTLNMSSVQDNVATFDFVTSKGRGRCLDTGSMKVTRRVDGMLVLETQDGKGVVTRANLVREAESPRVVVSQPDRPKSEAPPADQPGLARHQPERPTTPDRSNQVSPPKRADLNAWERQRGNCDSEIFSDPAKAAIADLTLCVRLVAVYRLDITEVEGSYRERLIMALRRVSTEGPQPTADTARYFLSRLTAAPPEE